MWNCAALTRTLPQQDGDHFYFFPPPEGVEDALDRHAVQAVAQHHRGTAGGTQRGAEGWEEGVRKGAMVAGRCSFQLLSHLAIPSCAATDSSPPSLLPTTYVYVGSGGRGR